MAQDPRKGANGRDNAFDTIRDAKTVRAPSRKAPDPLAGKQDDTFFTLGRVGGSIEAKLNAEQRRNARGKNGRF